MKQNHPGRILLLMRWAAVCLAGMACMFSLGSPASAAAAPAWHLEALANSTAAPGSQFKYYAQIINTGDEATSGEYSLAVSLPPELTAVSATGPFSCPGVLDSHDVVCTSSAELAPHQFRIITLTLAVSSEAGGSSEAAFEISGGGAGPVTKVDRTLITSDPPEFGVAGFDGALSNGVGGGSFEAQAAAHPDSFATTVEFNTEDRPWDPFAPFLWPVAAVKDVSVQLPHGLIGDPTAVPRCQTSELASGYGGSRKPWCDPASQIGTALVYTSGAGFASNVSGPLPVFNLFPPPDVPARFGFNVAGTLVTFNARANGAAGYSLVVDLNNVSEGLAILGSTVTLWGVPADEAHEPERACPGQPEPGFVFVSGPTCQSGATPAAFLRNPTSCTEADEGLPFTLRTDSWANPGTFKEAGFVTHEPPGYPLAPDQWGPERGIEGCDDLAFEPDLSVAPTTSSADSPSGIELRLSLPQDCWEPENQDLTCQSDLRGVEVTLPRGVSINPSSANGLGSCSEEQLGYVPDSSSPFRYTSSPAECPGNSKIGTVDIESPLLDDPLTGGVYLAEQGTNPFGSLLAIYLVAEGSGVTIKQAGEIKIDRDGRVTTRFSEVPQLPFKTVSVALKGGPRAPLRTPPTCGDHVATAELTPWSGKAAVRQSSSFKFTSGPGGSACPDGGFNPQLAAGTATPLAGAFSPFSLRVAREDGSAEIGGISTTLPPGLLAKLGDIPYCLDEALAGISGELGAGAAQIVTPSCPAASQLGTVTVGAGSGTNPFFTRAGRAYLAGPYRGAPISLAAVVPAVAGPFDLGNVIVRNALHINPETARITAVSDPLPTVLHGIPINLRDIRVELDRQNFTLNPTSCNRMSIGATLTSVEGLRADRSVQFQLGGCRQLGFKPRLSIRLKGRNRRGGYPALRAALTMPARNPGANIARVSVGLPHSEFLAQSHLDHICTRVQYAAGEGGGWGCPPGSVYGRARAFTPLLKRPLEGPVYLRSSSHLLPDLVASLDGQIHVDLVGTIDSKNGGIRTTFATVPDAPVSKFVISMKGGKRGLLENSTNICANSHRATVRMDAHNGKLRDFRTVLKADCGKTRKRPG